MAFRISAAEDRAGSCVTLGYPFRESNLLTSRPIEAISNGTTIVRWIGVPRLVVSKVLNHAGNTDGAASVTAVYDRNAYLTEKREVVDAWVDLLMKIIAGQPHANDVVQMSRQQDRLRCKNDPAT